jgi:hypothetical protein
MFIEADGHKHPIVNYFQSELMAVSNFESRIRGFVLLCL